MHTDQQLKHRILKQMGQLAPNWEKLQPNKLTVQRMSGITNETFKVSHPDIDYSLIYRKFSDAEDNIFLNRQKEEFIYQYLSDHKIGPKVHGMSQDIRLQQFIQSKVLKTNQMLTRPIVQKIAYSLRQFHSMKPTTKITKQSLFQLTFFNQKSSILHKCQSKMQKPIFTEQQKTILKILKKWINKQQIQFIKKCTKQLQGYQLVFSHNDLLPGNVLIRNSDNKTMFIDYQYSCFNYRVYDIANYFNQSIYNYEVKQTPYFQVIKLSQQEQKMKDQLIRCYALAQTQNYQEYLKKVAANTELSQKQMKIYKEVKQNLVLGQMLSHLMWGYWAVIVSKNPQIQFDYIKFALHRFQSYQKQKQLYLTNK